LITTPDAVFKKLTITDFKHKGPRPVIVVDFWRILDKELANQPNVCYIPIGRSIDDAANAVRLNELWGNTVTFVE
jgi:hypothetical protein